MQKFLENITELLEEETVEKSAVLNEFDAWDSLTILSIISMADEEYNVTISADEINSAKTVEGLFNLINSK